jgi:hypothetical protein
MRRSMPDSAVSLGGQGRMRLTHDLVSFSSLECLMVRPSCLSCCRNQGLATLRAEEQKAQAVVPAQRQLQVRVVVVRPSCLSCCRNQGLATLRAEEQKAQAVVPAQRQLQVRVVVGVQRFGCVQAGFGLRVRDALMNVLAGARRRAAVRVRAANSPARAGFGVRARRDLTARVRGQEADVLPAVRMRARGAATARVRRQGADVLPTVRVRAARSPARAGVGV